MSNTQRKRAMRRLAQDQQELHTQPVDNVSAAPLDSDMFQWHCNIRQNDVIYHLILFMPDNYPFKSPSAEFMPVGFGFSGGVTMAGKKGTKVCLNIFSDFAHYHTEWQNQKGFGWSPGYTTQTVLMNLVAFLAETGEHLQQHNQQLSMGFTCQDCGHTYDKPFPPFDHSSQAGHKPVKGKGKAGKGVAAKNTPSPVPSPTQDAPEIIDYISKTRFELRQPQSRDELYGYGLVVSGPPHRPSLTTPCEFLSGESFFSMKASMKVVHSSLKEELKFFLPLYIHPTHGGSIKDTFEKTVRSVGDLLPSVKKGATLEEMILKTLPNLMAATVVEFSKGTQHTSDNSLHGYFALHRLLLWALHTYPLLQPLLEARLQDFIDNEEQRTKTACPHIGEWLMLLSGSLKYRWADASEAYLYESMRRQVMWYVKDDSKLGFLDTDRDYRITHTFTSTQVSRKILAFQVLFLDIAMPSDMTRKQIVERYDAHFGFPTSDMVQQMKAACDVIKNKMHTYDDWFKVLGLEPWSVPVLYQRLVEAVDFSILHDGYHWSIPSSAAGWKAVMFKYKDRVKEFKDKQKAVKAQAKEAAKAQKEKAKEEEKAAKAQAKEEAKAAKAGGKTGQKEEREEAAAAKPAGRGRGGPRGRSKARGRGWARDDSGPDSEQDMELEAQTAKGRGRGRGRGAKRGASGSASRSPGPPRKKARK